MLDTSRGIKISAIKVAWFTIAGLPLGINYLQRRDIGFEDQIIRILLLGIAVKGEL